MERDKIKTIKGYQSPLELRRAATCKLREDKMKKKLLEDRKLRFDSPNFNQNIGGPTQYCAEGEGMFGKESSPRGSAGLAGGQTPMIRALSVLIGRQGPSETLTIDESLHVLRSTTTNNQHQFILAGVHTALINILKMKTGCFLSETTFNTLYVLTNLASGPAEDVDILMSNGLIPIIEKLTIEFMAEIRGRTRWYSDNNISLPFNGQPLTRDQISLSCNIIEQIMWMAGNIVVENDHNRMAVYKSKIPLMLGRLARVFLREMNDDNRTTLVWSMGKMAGEPMGILDVRRQSDQIVIEDCTCSSVVSSYVCICAELFMSPSSVVSSSVIGSAIHCLVNFYKNASTKAEKLPNEEDLIVRLVELSDDTNAQYTDSCVITNAVKLLGYIARVSHGGALKIRGSVFPSLLPSLIKSRSPRVSKAALSATGCLAMGENAGAVLLSGSPMVIECVIDKLASPDIKVIDSALWVLNLSVERKMTSYGEYAQQNSVFELRNLTQSLLEICRKQSFPGVVISSLSVLRMLLTKQNETDDDSMEVDNVFWRVAQANNLYNTLDGLSRSDNFELSAVANELFHELFSGEVMMDE